MTELICIVCPKGCHLRVDEEKGYTVSGNACARGEEYGRVELTAPTRMVTSTVAVQGGLYPRCPVKTSKPVPKAAIFDVMRALDTIVLQAPVALGHLVVSDVCGTGADIVATREMCEIAYSK